MAGNMLHNRQYPAIKQSVADEPSNIGNQLRACAKGTIADDLTDIRRDHIENRKAVDRNTYFMKIGGDQPGMQPRGPPSGFEVVFGKPAENPARRQGSPCRWAQTLDASALLVNQDRRVGATDLLTEIIDKFAKLVF